MSRRSLLLVGGERSVADDLRWYLEREHFLVHQAATGKDALTLISQSGADIVLIDEIDDMSPNNLCEQLRARPAIAAMPVIVLTAENDDQTRVKALNAGADDCVAHPFSAIELIARVHAVLRRVSPELIGAKLTLGDVEMDLAAHRVRRRGKIIQLGNVEYKILRHFLENPGRVFARAQLVRLLWKNESDIQLRTIDSHIRRLRKTLNTGGLPDLFRTVRAVGYSIELEPVKWVMALLLGYWGLPDSFA